MKVFDRRKGWYTFTFKTIHSRSQPVVALLWGLHGALIGIGGGAIRVDLVDPVRLKVRLNCQIMEGHSMT
jgi:microcystin degradation protein MlrC